LKSSTLLPNLMNLAATLATTVGIILWLSSYYFFFVPLEKNYQTSSFLDKITVALIPNMALHLAIKVMSAFEGKGWQIMEREKLLTKTTGNCVAVINIIDFNLQRWELTGQTLLSLLAALTH